MVGAESGEEPRREKAPGGAARAEGGRWSLAVPCPSLQELKESCIRNQDCETGCCQRAPDNCESHCAEKGSEGSLCQTQHLHRGVSELPPAYLDDGHLSTA
ncbi:colipase-like protein 1 isoform X2 [Homo sapiens]|uniref:colipase-like protein 1 isoform X2 n=1 Tax=Homo sapiens TaxID=9606 RepID=UPI0007DC523B|nr:colipase-like protein 1 isoform X2 [Homo sapiens]XP_054211294.1 colipase-like protein 1 isoform X2 [Homo sapiens]|eukprot:XP_016866310.1 colipase-like protein 1 isoform X2 [Homo sapiens]